MRTPCLATALLVAGCAATPPGPAMEQFRALEDSNASLLRERTALEARVGDLEKMLVALERKAEGTANQIARLETESKFLEIEKANLEARLAGSNEDAAQKLPMYKWRSRPGSTPPPIEGTVLAADSKMSIYVLSLGSKDGVKVCDEFTVYRGDSFVAVLVVDKVFENKSSAVVKRQNGKPMQKSEIKTGDSVVTAL